MLGRRALLTGLLLLLQMPMYQLLVLHLLQVAHLCMRMSPDLKHLKLGSVQLQHLSYGYLMPKLQLLQRLEVQ